MNIDENNTIEKVDIEKIRTLTDRGILELTSEFETGNAIDFHKYEEGLYSFVPNRDPGTNYSGQAYYFKFSAKNLTKENLKFTISAVADYDDTWKGWMPAIETKLWKYIGATFNHLESKFIRAKPESITINLELLPKQEIKISNMLTIPYSEMVDELKFIQMDYPTFVKLNEIGQSNDENSIFSLIIDPQNKNWKDSSKIKILVSGSPQCNEFGDFASIKLLRKFLREGGEFWDKFHQHFKLEFLFFQNPDGIIQGKNMVNSKGENIFFSFNKDLNNLPKESTVIWEYISQDPPDLYLEYHSFFQDLKTIRPYIYPLSLFSSKSKKKIYKKIKNNLISYCNGAKQEIKIDQPYFSDTLSYRLQEKYNSLSIQFKLHSCMDFEDTKEIIWVVFKKILTPLKKLSKME